MADDAKGSIETLNVGTMRDALTIFKDNVKEFQDSRNKIESITSELLSTWNGIARNSYEVQYNLLSRNLKDIEDSLYDLYDGVVEAVANYEETDEKIAKAFNDSSK